MLLWKSIILGVTKVKPFNCRKCKKYPYGFLSEMTEDLTMFSDLPTYYVFNFNLYAFVLQFLSMKACHKLSTPASGYLD